MKPMEISRSVMTSVSKIVAILASVIFVAFAVIGLVVVVKNLASSSGAVSALLAAISLSREGIRLEASPAAPLSGRELNLRWTHERKSGPGSYELRYPCRDALTLLSVLENPIPCNAPFPLSATTSITLIPVSTEAAPLVIAFSVGFVPNGRSQSTVSGSVALTVSPPQATTTAATPPAPSASPPPTPPRVSKNPPPPPPTAKSVRIDANGVPDLTVRVITTGIMNAATGELRPAPSVGQGERAGVMFDVINIGTAVSGRWRFSANVPTLGGSFASESQAPLAPGDRVRFTIGFGDLIRSGENAAVFTVDPGNELKDANRANDTATAILLRSY